MSVLEVVDLHVDYRTRRRDRSVAAVKGVSFEVAEGETLGLVGESGSGKSSVGKAILGLVPTSSGEVFYRGQSISRLNRAQRSALSQKVQVVFQDPYSSLNPSRNIGSLLSEPLRIVQRMDKQQAMEKVRYILEQVGMPADVMERYPAAFSGGQRQRIAIARALAVGPELIICDEPTSSLDLSVQAQIVNLFIHLQREFGLSYLFISHDIDVVKHISHKVAVMFKGEIVEIGDSDVIIGSPSNSYTKKLISSVL